MSEIVHNFGYLLQENEEKKDRTMSFISTTEAEGVKLFANTYLRKR